MLHPGGIIAEAADVLDTPTFDPKQKVDKDVIPCYDPATMQLLGHMPAMSTAEVRCSVRKAGEGGAIGHAHEAGILPMHGVRQSILAVISAYICAVM